MNDSPVGNSHERHSFLSENGGPNFKDAESPNSSAGRRRRKKRSLFRQMVLVLWKNLLLRKRHWVLTTFEIIIPVLLFIILLSVRVLPDSAFIPEKIDNTTYFGVTDEVTLKNITCRNFGYWFMGMCVPDPVGIFVDRQIFYGPRGNFTERVARYVAQEIGLKGLSQWSDVLTPVNSTEQMNELVQASYLLSNKSADTYYVGLFFQDTDGDEVPLHLKYDLRMEKLWWTDMLYPFLQVPGPRNSSLFGSFVGSYNMDGFTLIQSLVDRFFIAETSGDESFKTDYTIETEMYPYPPYIQDDGMSQIYGSALPTFIVLSLVLLSPSLIKSIVHEKETGVRELVKLMGMNSLLGWIGWFIHSFIVILLVSAIITIMLKIEVTPTDGGGKLPAILANSDGSVIWVFLLVYGITSIAFCMAISTFFSKPTLATTMGILIWLVTYFIPRTMLDFEYDTMGLAPKMASCLLPNMALTWAFRIISMFEGRSIGLQWDMLWETGNPRDQLTPGMVLIMLLVDTIFFFLVTWYVDQINPGKYGVPQPWYFPFQASYVGLAYKPLGGQVGRSACLKLGDRRFILIPAGSVKGSEMCILASYWCGSRQENSFGDDDLSNDSSAPRKDYIESEPVGLRPGIVIKNLRKEFKSLGSKTTVAVENVSFNCYEGQCTVLLGHNGAGKTTTMSVLTGVYGPTSGFAEVGGWNIATHLKEAREEVGLCPQHNMLFVDLTVYQHLLFFGRLKGMQTKDAGKEAMVLMDHLELTEKKNMYGNQLSGGMKRKLCLAISLIGGSKVVILDEPSSGLDPESRRWVWDVVQRERGRRTILVTTHHMEEADVLGDRIAIMAAGKVVASGSTLFLKNKFGDGYTLTLNVSEESNDSELRNVVAKHLPSAIYRSNQGGEVTFKLPPTTSSFAPLLKTLASRKSELGIRHFGLSLTSMEQVFLRVGSVVGGEEEEEPKRYSSSISNGTNGMANGHSTTSLNENNTSESQRYLYDSQSDVEMNLTGASLMFQRLKAFFAKRFIYTKRKWVLLLIQALLPVLVTILCLAVDASFDESSDVEPSLLLNTSIYSGSQYFVRADAEDSVNYDLALKYEELFWGRYKVNYTNDITTSLLDQAEKNLFYYRENNICSADFHTGNDNLTAMRVMYQSIPFHTPAVGMSLVTNALLRYATNSSEASITAYNSPLPPNRSFDPESDNTSGSALVYSMMMPMALAFLAASYLVFPLQERESKSKQVQVMTGAPLWALWTTSFLWDFLAYCFSALLILVTILIGDTKDYFTVAGAPGALFLLLFTFGWGSIPMAYVFSFPFQTAASGFAVLAVLNIFAGQILSVAVWALNISQSPTLELASTILNWIGSIVPTYRASMGFNHLVEISHKNTYCDLIMGEAKKTVCAVLEDFRPYEPFVMCCDRCAEVGNKTCFVKTRYLEFSDQAMGQDILVLFVNGLIFFAILILIEIDNGRFFRWLWWHVRRPCSRINADVTLDSVVDEDVIAEDAIVTDMIQARRERPGVLDDATMLVKGLTKTFYGAIRPAVNNVGFRVGRGECLGLLGVNGAGKTTTFRMLTGDEKPSAGDAYSEDNISMTSDTRKFVRQIGYCPQFDAIINELTGEEMLTLMGRLRGVSESRLKHVVAKLVTLVDITACAKRPSATYSGGNKRKLSTAMALIGSPPLVFLDEPTSGVDPASRRRVWSAISQAVSNGQSVVLTSHSMEECEALCSRVIIMSRGQLRCVGSTGHLKAKYGQGYSLQIKLKTYNSSEGSMGTMIKDSVYESKVAELRTTISQMLPGSKLIDQHKGMLAYRIPISISWDRLFSVMESLKTGKDVKDATEGATDVSLLFSSSMIEDYAASDTSLEQVFLSFAREANERAPVNIPTEVVTKF